MKKGKNKEFSTPYTVTNAVAKGNIITKLSLLIMGLGNIAHKQIGKGIMFLAVEAAYIWYMIQSGIYNLSMLPSLGWREQEKVWNEKKSIYEYTAGDQSSLILLYGVATVYITAMFIIVWRESVKSSYKSEVLAKSGKHLNNFKEDCKSLLDQNLYKLLLAAPVMGILIFTILPLIYNITMAFTNYSKVNDHLVLFDWVGLANFKKILNFGDSIGKQFYSLSIAMGILITFGSYMKKETSLEDSTRNVEVFDTAIAIMAGLMIIPAVFSFSGGDPDTLQAGPALMFITIPKVFENMGFGTVVGILFFLLVLFAAVTSSIALTESAVSTFEDELGWSRRRATVLVGVIMIALGSLSSLGYGPLVGIKIIGMQFLDFFDFLTNSVMMPIAAMLTSLFVSRIVGMKRMEEEIMHGESTFRRKKIFIVMIKYLCPVFALIILISSVANAFGWIAM